MKIEPSETGWGERELQSFETYQPPPPPKNGKIIGVDCHPDSFVASVVKGTTPHNAVRLSTKSHPSLERFIKWATANFDEGDHLLDGGRKQ